MVCLSILAFFLEAFARASSSYFHLSTSEAFSPCRECREIEVGGALKLIRVFTEITLMFVWFVVLTFCLDFLGNRFPQLDYSLFLAF